MQFFFQVNFMHNYLERKSGGLQVDTWNAIGHILHLMDWYEILYGMLSLLPSTS